MPVYVVNPDWGALSGAYHPPVETPFGPERLPWFMRGTIGQFYGVRFLTTEDILAMNNDLPTRDKEWEPGEGEW